MTTFHNDIHIRGLHGNGACGNPVDSAGMGKMLQEYSGDRNGSSGDPAGMEFVFAETQRGSFRNLADDKNSTASVRIPYQVDCRKMSYVTAKYAPSVL